jgi:hypothetical protein
MDWRGSTEAMSTRVSAEQGSGEIPSSKKRRGKKKE